MKGKMNLKNVKKMSEKELNGKIAELCGWEMGPKMPISLGAFRHVPPKTYWHRKTEKDSWQSNPPNFCNDLNAMHEVEWMMSKIQWVNYVMVLCGYYKAKNIQWSGEDALKVVVATARQRAEAFVLTMEEKQ